MFIIFKHDKNYFYYENVMFFVDQILNNLTAVQNYNEHVFDFKILSIFSIKIESFFF